MHVYNLKMMTKQEKNSDHTFIVVENPLDRSYTIVLSNFKFWSDREDELIKYCEKYSLSYQGIIVAHLAEKDVMMFKLAWG